MEDGGGPSAKRARPSSDALVAVPQASTDLMLRQPQEPGRTSSLGASTMLLQGHQAAVYTVQFSPDGEALASGSFDKEICEWVVGCIGSMCDATSPLDHPTCTYARTLPKQHTQSCGTCTGRSARTTTCCRGTPTRCWT